MLSACFHSGAMFLYLLSVSSMVGEDGKSG